MSSKHDNRSAKKSESSIDIKQKAIDMLIYFIDYIKLLTEYL